MRILVWSDLHLDFAGWTPDFTDGVDAVVIAGDSAEGTKGVLWAAGVYPGVPKIMIPGNHEPYGCRTIHGQFAASKRALERVGNDSIHYVNNEVVEIDGVRFAATTLWTDLDKGNPYAKLAVGRGLNDYRQIWGADEQAQLTVEETMEANRVAVAFLREQAGKVDVVVTHHLPTYKSVHPVFKGDPLNPGFASELDWLIEEVGAKVWVHGHTHRAVDYEHLGTRIVCNPRGYPGEKTGFDPVKVAEI